MHSVAICPTVERAGYNSIRFAGAADDAKARTSRISPRGAQPFPIENDGSGDGDGDGDGDCIGNDGDGDGYGYGVNEVVVW